MTHFETFAVSDRRVLEIAFGITYAADLDATAYLGAVPGLGDTPPGFGRMESTAVGSVSPAYGILIDEELANWRLSYRYKSLPWEPPPKYPPEFSGADTPERLALGIADTRLGLGRAHLVKLDKAIEIVTTVVTTYLRSVQIATQQVISSGKPAYRDWESFNRLRIFCAHRLAKVRQELIASSYFQRRPKKGVQRISTRRPRSSMPREGMFWFNGKRAYRGNIGRRPFTAAEWLRRAVARRNARSGGHPRPTRRKRIKVPKTQWPRPTHYMTPVGAHDTVQPRNAFRGVQQYPYDPLDLGFNPADLDPDIILASLPDVDISGQV